jgi:hypothetical protein
MRHPLQLTLLTAIGLSTGCDEVEMSMDGLSSARYNPCGLEVDPQDCHGGKPAEDRQGGDGIFQAVRGSRGTHTLDVMTRDCSIELDTLGTTTTTDLCPDCTLVLEMSHVSIDDGCNLGPLTYESLVGLLPRGNGDYAVYLSTDGADWYGFGDATVEGQTLSYSAMSIYDVAYGGYYGSTPAYGFTGDHILTLD